MGIAMCDLGERKARRVVRGGSGMRDKVAAGASRTALHGNMQTGFTAAIP